MHYCCGLICQSVPSALALHLAYVGGGGEGGRASQHGFASCEDLAVNPAKAPNPFNLDLDCHCPMYREDFEVCHQYTAS